VRRTVRRAVGRPVRRAVRGLSAALSARTSGSHVRFVSTGTHSGSRTNRTDKFFPIGCPLVRTRRFRLARVTSRTGGPYPALRTTPFGIGLTFKVRALTRRVWTTRGDGSSVIRTCVSVTIASWPIESRDSALRGPRALSRGCAGPSPLKRAKTPRTRLRARRSVLTPGCSPMALERPRESPSTHRNGNTMATSSNASRSWQSSTTASAPSASSPSPARPLAPRLEVRYGGHRPAGDAPQGEGPEGGRRSKVRSRRLHSSLDQTISPEGTACRTQSVRASVSTTR
jgi:hypothetical protein